MKLFTRVPLAWLNLIHQKRRLVVSLAGVAFAVVLMFMEMGFWNALLDGIVSLIQAFNADLVILNKQKYALNVNEPFTRRRLQQALAVRGVRAAYPLYLESRSSFWKNPEPDSSDQSSIWPIRVVAFDPADPVLLIPEIQVHARQLQLPDTALMDVKSKKHFGRCAADVERELARRHIRVVGTFSLGTDFSIDGNLLMSDRNFAKFFPDTPSASVLGKVEVGLIRIDAEADLITVQQTLRQTLPDDVIVLTKDEYARMESKFWQSATPVGFVFGLGLAMGFAVGVVICYQILSADIGDHLPEFATLKAIGYSNRYLTGVVLQEALLLALLGFVPGLLISALLYGLLENHTGLPLCLTLLRGGLVLVLTVSMCFVSGVIAVRKVQTADPAEVF
jgi:putative ABC transport system permease protein